MRSTRYKSKLHSNKKTQNDQYLRNLKSCLKGIIPIDDIFHLYTKAQTTWRRKKNFSNKISHLKGLAVITESNEVVGRAGREKKNVPSEIEILNIEFQDKSPS